MSRGGKTTILRHIFERLEGEVEYVPIIITFNGTDNFFRFPSESNLQFLLRVIASQLIRVGPDEDVRSLRFCCSAAALLKNLNATPGKVVLIIDELNVLSQPLDEETATFLKNNFLDRKDRYLIFSTHVRMDVDTVKTSLGQIWSSPSPRSVKTVPLRI